MTLGTRVRRSGQVVVLLLIAMALAGSWVHLVESPPNPGQPVYANMAQERL
jgi:hypothetical protein